ncbi:MAG TPA: hypothetical protein VK604_06745 [Bryobacteraceae bacterium]|nr:hypothetical protein [Bryobacteraceae bacterium]
MFNFRRLFVVIILCAAFAAGSASAQANLTHILDSITNPDGSLFNGTVVITWNGSPSSGVGTVAPLRSATAVYGGALSIFLAPTTTAPAGTYYVVAYNSSNGLITWSEVWQVPPGAVPLSVSQVRQSSTKGPGGGSNGGGAQYATLPIAINQVTNLGTSLNTLNTSVASLNSELDALAAQVNSGSSLPALQAQVAALSTTVAALGVSVTGNTDSLGALTTNLTALNSTVNTNGDSLTALGATVGTLTTAVTNLTTTVNSLGAGGSNALFVDSQTPAGTANGTNNSFALTQTPSPSASLSLYRNGLLQMNGVNFTVAGTALTFLAGNRPQSGDILEAYYRVSGASTSVAIFVDGEIPGGSITGTNATFTLASSPSPVTSLRLYKNGVLLSPVNDFTLAGATITFVTAAIPQSADTLQASYRH